MMDWYFGHDVGDLVVPKDQEYFDRLPSPDSWSQWGSGGFGNLGWPNNFNAEKIVNPPNERPHQRMSFGRCNNEMSQSEERSFGSSSLGASYEDTLQRNYASCGRPDYQVDDLMEADAMDDIFMSSLLEDDFPAAAHNHSSVGMPPQPLCIVMPADSDSTNMMVEFQSISSDTDGAGNSNRHITVLNLGYGSSSGQSNGSSVKALETMDMLPSDPRRCGDEDSSIEESVLFGLEAVLSQLSNSTRLCFRDSLYRLAKRSKQQLSSEAQMEDLSLDKSAMLETGNEQIRSTRTGTAESETNTIDRAVANLMFNKAQENMQDHLPPVSAKFEHQGTTCAAAYNYESNQPDSFVVSKPMKLQADSEVPVFRQ